MMQWDLHPIYVYMMLLYIGETPVCLERSIKYTTKGNCQEAPLRFPPGLQKTFSGQRQDARSNSRAIVNKSCNMLICNMMQILFVPCFMMDID